MIISEFLPNPAGKDTEGEWIELFNDGQEVVILNSWQIKDASGKTFFLKNKINPGEYLVLDYKTTKISLNNNGETIFLYDQKGNLIDKAEFAGIASEGKSLVRQNNNQFIFSDRPTPGEANFIEIQAKNLAAVVPGIKQNGTIVNRGEFNFSNSLIGLSLALVLALLFIVIFKKLNLSSE